VDSQASAFIQEEYENHLRPGMKVLDLMSSMESHLPENMDLEITGLGMNREELAANPRLSDFLVQDLNKEPQLPFPEGHFDVAVCSLSIEYLVRPLEVLRELSRVLKPGGRCLVSFSDRWHAPKAIALWSELNEFERMGLVQEYFLKSGGFEGVRTFSRRNWWRPETDSYYGRLPASDPVYMVTAAAVETGSARNDPSTP
jgi:SAM-dependent methyltransferase